MKLINKIFYILCAIVILLCMGITFLAFNPDITDKLAQKLYGSTNSETEGNQENASTTQTQDTDIETDVSGNDGVTEHSQVEKVSVETDGIPKEAYITPLVSDIQIPEAVEGKSGYTTPQESKVEIESGEENDLKSQLSVGETGEKLTFDSRFYPYYNMLDESLQSLYRQIYANANALSQSFLPIVSVNTEQLMKVFESVINDHPELFWLETAYSCRYSADGTVVELTLEFNETADNLEEEKVNFSAAANQIIAGANNLNSNYEKEKYVHDALAEMVQYNISASMNQSAYSALVNHATVCAGYARAYQYVLQELGIPTYYCTGFSGENHAWNIVELEGAYYNVDVTWDDLEPCSYEYFNKTDAEYATTHIRKSLSVNLPACNGSTYGNLEIVDASSSQEVPGEVLNDITNYYNVCYEQIVNSGVGETIFYTLLSASLWEQVNAAYDNESFKTGYLQNALTQVGGSSCDVNLLIEELEDGNILLYHTIQIK